MICFSDYKKKTELDVKDKFPLNLSSEVQIYVNKEKTTGCCSHHHYLYLEAASRLFNFFHTYIILTRYRNVFHSPRLLYLTLQIIQTNCYKNTRSDFQMRSVFCVTFQYNPPFKLATKTYNNFDICFIRKNRKAEGGSVFFIFLQIF